MRQAQPGRSYQLTGTVVDGSVHRDGAVLDFSVEDRAGGDGASRSPTPAPCPTRSAKAAR